jgi:hypothetical protein
MGRFRLEPLKSGLARTIVHDVIDASAAALVLGAR